MVGKVGARSTKAGASTPATLYSREALDPQPFIALNEGRGINPGDTRRIRPQVLRHTAPLNEGRGINPGDTVSRSLH